MSSTRYYNHPPSLFPGRWYGETPRPSLTYNDALGSIESQLVGDNSMLKTAIVAGAAYHGYKKYGKMGGIGFGLGALFAPLITAGLVGYQTMKGGFGK